MSSNYHIINIYRYKYLYSLMLGDGTTVRDHPTPHPLHIHELFFHHLTPLHRVKIIRRPILKSQNGIAPNLLIPYEL